MYKFTRTACPEYLAICWESLGNKFAASKLSNPHHKFVWVAAFRYQASLQHLFAMTDGHCAFCDGGDIGSTSRRTIEHFRPKNEFHLLAYQWENLYPCCDQCQSQKLDKFYEDLLVGDQPGYDFSAYFMVDYNSGSLEPNPVADERFQRRALTTLELYGLNIDERKISRKKELKRYLKRDKQSDLLNDFSYRYYLADA